MGLIDYILRSFVRLVFFWDDGNSFIFDSGGVWLLRDI